MIQTSKTWTQLLIWLQKDACSVKSRDSKKSGIFGAGSRSFASSVNENWQVFMTSYSGQTVDTWASRHLCNKESFSQSETDVPSPPPPHWKGATTPLHPPPASTSKCSNSFQFSWSHWLSIRHGVIKEWMRNNVASAVALISLSEPSGRFFIKGGHKEERGDGWRCPPDKSACTGNHCLVQPGSTKAPQLRVGIWQGDPPSWAACTRPQTSLLPRPILHGCTCQGLFAYPWSPSPQPVALKVPYCFPACQIILPWFLNYSTYFPTSFTKWENCAAWILGLCLSDVWGGFVFFFSFFFLLFFVS